MLIAGSHSIASSGAIFEARIHYSGHLWLNVQALGTLGSGPGCESGACIYNNPKPADDLRELGINWQPSLEFPGGSKSNYIYLGSPMVGCIKGTDTLVSTCWNSLIGYPNEFNAFARIRESSYLVASPKHDARALADQEYFCVYTDTSVAAVPQIPLSLDVIDRRHHKPIGLEVSQTSRSWSNENENQFIIIDLWVRNISKVVLHEPSIGITVWPLGSNYDYRPTTGTFGQMTGFLGEVRPGPDAPPDVLDSLNTVWFANASGLPDPAFTRYSPTAAVGYRILRTPPGTISFNWWSANSLEQNWGPSRLENSSDYTAKQAQPMGDKSIFQSMTNGEIDYDNMYATHDYSALGWKRPATDAAFALAVATGRAGVFFSLSSGPYPDLMPGDSIPFTYAILAGKDFHARPDNYSRNFDPRDPQVYRDYLNFTDLISTARAADWYFDNPGIDTDGDGYAGKFYLTNCIGERCDTVWYKGDGVPDWGGPKAPPSPHFEVTTHPNTVTLRWTGAVSETAKDQLSRQRDFEGYRVYDARANAVGEYALVGAWDIPDNFYRLAYDPGRGNWRQISYPQTVSQWQKELNDPDFDPIQYPGPSLAYAYVDTVVDTVRNSAGTIIRIDRRERHSYWATQGPNQGNTYLDGGEVYQNNIQQVELRDTIIGGDTLQYRVYEMVMDNLNAAIPLWFAITAFDHGDYKRDVETLEGSPSANAQFSFPVYSADVVEDSGLKVTVYPNPYRIAFKDAQGRKTNYFNQGYEGYGQPVMDERDRRIWFANLPDTATIRIYSLDGDLIREIHHPDRFLTRYSSVVGWDLVSRNTQAIVSGIYIWRVDSRLGSQIGKIVIIK